jgi:cytochrome P450
MTTTTTTDLKISKAPKGEPLFGHMRQFSRDSLAYAAASAQYGDLVEYQFGPFPFYIINHPDLVAEVLVRDADSYQKTTSIKQVMKPAVGQGLFTNEGDSWKRQRKLAQPAFHTRRIANYADVMVRFAQQTMADWKDGEALNMEHEMSGLTMRIISKTMFDSDLTGDDAQIEQAVKVTLGTVDKRLNLLVPYPEWLPTRSNREFKQSIRMLDTIIQGYIDQRRQSEAAGNLEDRADLLSMLMAAQDEETGSGMSDQQLRDESVTVFGAGHETTSVALTWTWYLLSQYPEVEQKLHEELDRVLAGRIPTFADLPNLPYTEMIIKESMRLFPPAWTTTREAARDTTLGGFPIKKGRILMVNIYGIHHDARFFDDPWTFNPERFSPENEKNIQKYAYFPFGAGPRVCIGNAFAMMEGRLILATMGQRYQFDLPSDQKVEPMRMFTLKPKFGMQMTARLRETMTAPEYA